MDNNNFSEKLNKILSDPQGMEQIMALAKSLSEREDTAQPQTEQTAVVPQSEAQSRTQSQPQGAPALDMLKSLVNSPVGQAFLSGEQERIQLLSALKPYLGEPKKEKLSRVISTMESVGSISSLAKLL